MIDVVSIDVGPAEGVAGDSTAVAHANIPGGKVKTVALDPLVPDPEEGCVSVYSFMGSVIAHTILDVRVTEGVYVPRCPVEDNEGTQIEGVVDEYVIAGRVEVRLTGTNPGYAVRVLIAIEY